MKRRTFNILGAIVLLMFSNIYSQNKLSLYDKIVMDIKNSKELALFTTSHNIEELNFEIKEHLYPFCESYNVFKKSNLNKKIIESCSNGDWFSSKLIKEEALKNKISKGEKPMMVYFTNSIENHIIVEIVAEIARQESLFFLYKFDDKNSIEKLKAIHIFKN